MHIGVFKTGTKFCSCWHQRDLMLAFKILEDPGPEGVSWTLLGGSKRLCGASRKLWEGCRRFEGILVGFWEVLGRWEGMRP